MSHRWNGGNLEGRMDEWMDGGGEEEAVGAAGQRGGRTIRLERRHTTRKIPGPVICPHLTLRSPRSLSFKSNTLSPPSRDRSPPSNALPYYSSIHKHTHAHTRSKKPCSLLCSSQQLDGGLEINKHAFTPHTLHRTDHSECISLESL